MCLLDTRLFSRSIASVFIPTVVHRLAWHHAYHEDPQPVWEHLHIKVIICILCCSYESLHQCLFQLLSTYFLGIMPITRTRNQSENISTLRYHLIQRCSSHILYEPCRHAMHCKCTLVVSTNCYHSFPAISPHFIHKPRVYLFMCLTIKPPFRLIISGFCCQKVTNGWQEKPVLSMTDFSTELTLISFTVTRKSLTRQHHPQSILTYTIFW